VAPNAYIIVAHSAADFEAAHTLFAEYEAEIAASVCFPHVPDEPKQIQATYLPPRGSLLLARLDDAVVGSAGFCPLEEDICELKRVYVRPSMRGSSLGRRLTLEAIDRAHAAGYRRMVLHTLTSMRAAHALYRSLGFRDGTSYGDPVEGAVYMDLLL
jgi:ribosomal protein S18 acetylase RimI-like enzyme